LSTTSIIVLRTIGAVPLQSFSAIYEKAAARKGGARELESLLPKPKTAAQLKRITDDRYLAEDDEVRFPFRLRMADHREQDGPVSRAAFDRFDTTACAMLSMRIWSVRRRRTHRAQRQKDRVGARQRAVRARSARANTAASATYLAAWPADDVVGLWDELKRRGQRLGGNSGPFFLRFVGKDTFMLSADVVNALTRQRVIDKRRGSKKALAAVQDAFNDGGTRAAVFRRDSRTWRAAVG
jgi:hypothetical protein